MKKLIALCFASALWIAGSSFSGKWGGDVFAIYLNGKQVHRQALHADPSVKTLSLFSANKNDKVEVLYSHCGQGGKARTITIRNGENALLKTFSFGDASSERSLMGFYRKEIAGSQKESMALYYAAAELPEGKLLVRIVWQEARPVVKL